MTKPQISMYYAAVQAAADRDNTFMDLVNHRSNPLTREDLEANIRRRPSLWKRYAGFLDKLPSRSS